jgi:pilus assembly protein CpaF
MFDGRTADLLRRLVERRVSFLVTGGTGSGKTTLLGALLAEVPADERVVLVEDVRELAVDHPHVVRLQSRSANVEGAGEVTLVDLVRQALRMRPDRLVVGEVRGAEVRELLAALNTGHDGGGGTVHANSPADVVPRFEALGALAGLGRDAVQAQLASAIQAVVHLRRDRATRRVASLSVLERHDGLGVAVALECPPSGAGPVLGPGWPRLAAMLGVAP